MNKVCKTLKHDKKINTTKEMQTIIINYDFKKIQDNIPEYVFDPTTEPG